jgi:hypothetical protein
VSDFSVPGRESGSPRWHFESLLPLPEFEHLASGGAWVEFLMRTKEQVVGGRRVLGSVHLPTVQGQLKGVFSWMLEEVFGGMPDFLVVLEDDYWKAATPREREILVYHELCHTEHKRDKEGELRFDVEERPVWGIVGHDVEEFNAVVRRYGAHSAEIQAFIGAASAGDAGRTTGKVEIDLLKRPL